MHVRPEQIAECSALLGIPELCPPILDQRTSPSHSRLPTSFRMINRICNSLSAERIEPRRPVHMIGGPDVRTALVAHHEIEPPHEAGILEDGIISGGMPAFRTDEQSLSYAADDGMR